MTVWIQRIFHRIVLVLGSAHLTLMAGLGIWLWSNPSTFGSANSPSTSCAISISILGAPVSLGSRDLRNISILVYTLFLTPGINLALPTILFLWLFIAQGPKLADSSLPSGTFRGKVRDALSYIRQTWPAMTGLLVLFTVDIIFIVDIELTLERNAKHQQDGEAQWTFGQILAVLLLILPLRAIIEAILARREKRRLGVALYEASRKGDRDDVELLLRKGANPNAGVKGFKTALQAALNSPNYEIINLLLQASAKRKGGTYSRAFTIAAERGASDTIKPMFDKGADPNAEEYGKALQAASAVGEWAIVKLLVDRGAYVNAQGGHYVDALHAASIFGHLDIVKLLLDNGVEVNAQSGEYGNALQAASLMGHLEIVKLLLDRGADVNAQGGKYGKALQSASMLGPLEIVKLLLDKGADVNAEGGFYGNALQAASMFGPLEIVKLLLDRGADVNAQGGEYWTALQAAASANYRKVNTDIVKLLLDKGADVNAQGGKYGTALKAASAKGIWGVDTVTLLLRHKRTIPNTQNGNRKSAP